MDEYLLTRYEHAYLLTIFAVPCSHARLIGDTRVRCSPGALLLQCRRHAIACSLQVVTIPRGQAYHKEANA